MTSEPASCFVWIWLPDANEPVVCGRLDDDSGRVSFTYARSYRARPDAVPIYEPELPLREGEQFAASGDRLPLCIDDTMPDSWGRRLVSHLLGAPTAELSEFTYLLQSSSDRFGALDFQASSTVYSPREADHPTLDDLAEAAARIDEGAPLDAALEAALLHGTSIGGARPKTLLYDRGRQLIAKFSSTTDTFPVVQGEFVAMELARRAGLDVAPVELMQAGGKFALLVDRFDRDTAGHRRRVVSALTVLGLTAFPEGRYATYVDLTHAIRARFASPSVTLRELFSRISFNILCGNTDDHGRNHAAYVTPSGLRLTPAYDICPQARSGSEVNQAMAFASGGDRSAVACRLIAAAGTYHLDPTTACDIVENQIAVIRQHWTDVCDAAHLTVGQRAAFMGRQFLHPYALDGL
jgi:serine/threonine-protein kinase HipA